MSLVERIYLELREGIVDGRYSPGQKLKAEHIAAHYEVSGGTVREALNRLLSDDLAVVTKGRGFRVAPFSVEDLTDITQARLTVEVECVRDAVRHGDEDWEMSVVGAFHHLAKLKPQADGTMDTRELDRRNRRFHERLIAGCRSPTLIAFQHQLFTRHYRYRRVALRDDVIVEQARRDHQALLATVTQRQAAAAAKIIRRHILRTQEAAEALVRAFEAGSQSRKSRVRPAAGAPVVSRRAPDNTKDR